MIVTVAELKHVLGIDPLETDEDGHLEQVIQSASDVVQGMTRRRFDTPIPRVEYQEGLGRHTIYLEGHIDDDPAADNPSETLDPTTSLKIARRPLCLGLAHNTDWEELTEGVEWERRQQKVIFLKLWSIWPAEDEFRLSYLDGYAHAPEDIRTVVLNLAAEQYNHDVNVASGLIGLKSESIGDYSYTRDLTVEGSGNVGKLNDTDMKTIYRYKRKFA